MRARYCTRMEMVIPPQKGRVKLGDWERGMLAEEIGTVDGSRRDLIHGNDLCLSAMAVHKVLLHTCTVVGSSNHNDVVRLQYFQICRDIGLRVLQQIGTSRVVNVARALERVEGKFSIITKSDRLQKVRGIHVLEIGQSG